MITLLSKVVWFLWTTFASDQAKADMQLVAKDFVKVLVLLLTLSFGFAVLFFVGLYFLAQWLRLHIDQAFICYVIATVLSLFFTSVAMIILFRYIILGFLKRAQDKGNDILNTFIIKKIAYDDLRAIASQEKQ